VAPVPPISGDTVAFEMPRKVSIRLPPTKTIDLFLFHVPEEASQLSLFWKHMITDTDSTLYIQVTSPYSSLQFLPLVNHESEIKTKSSRLPIAQVPLSSIPKCARSVTVSRIS
jgi:hypothetical protein